MREKSAIALGIQPSIYADLIDIAGTPAVHGLLEMMLTELARFWKETVILNLKTKEKIWKNQNRKAERQKYLRDTVYCSYSGTAFDLRKELLSEIKTLKKVY